MQRVLLWTCVLSVTSVLISEAQYNQQPGYNFYPGVYQPWQSYVPQAYPRSLGGGGGGGWDQRRVQPRLPYPGVPMQPRPQPDSTPDVEGPERDHPNPGPSGPEHESEADIIPARPDDGSGGGPTSATPGRRFRRLADPVMAVAFASSDGSEQGGSVVRDVRIANGQQAPDVAALPGVLSTAPLVPAGHGVVYYSDVDHSAKPQVTRPASRKVPHDDQQPDESQQQDHVVAAPDAQQQPQQEQVVVPSAPQSQSEQTGEEDGNPTANDQTPILIPAASVDEGEEDSDESEAPAADSKISPPKVQPVAPAVQPVRPPVAPQAEDESQDEEPVPVVPAVVAPAPTPSLGPKIGSKGVRRRVHIPQPVIPAQEIDDLPLVPQQAVKGGVKGGARGGVKGRRPIQIPEQAVKGHHPVPRQGVKGQTAVQVPEQAVKGQAPSQVPTQEEPETPVVVRLAPNPSPKGGRRRVHAHPHPVAPEAEVDVDVEVPQTEVRGGVKGGVKGRSARQQQQEAEVQDEAPQAPEQATKSQAPPAPQSKRRPAPQPQPVAPETQSQEEPQLPQQPQQAVKG